MGRHCCTVRVVVVVVVVERELMARGFGKKVTTFIIRPCSLILFFASPGRWSGRSSFRFSRGVFFFV